MKLYHHFIFIAITLAVLGLTTCRIEPDSDETVIREKQSLANLSKKSRIEDDMAVMQKSSNKIGAEGEEKNGIWYEENDTIVTFRLFLNNLPHGKMVCYHKNKSYFLWKGRYLWGNMSGNWRYFNENRELVYELINIMPTESNPAYNAILVKYFAGSSNKNKKIESESGLLFNSENWRNDPATTKHGDEKIHNEEGKIVRLNRWEEGKLIESQEL